MVNFRNYERLDLDLAPGMILIQGGNGQGKSNLLEALYMLAIAKSPRTSTDRELVRWHPSPEPRHSSISAVVRNDADELRVQIDFKLVPVKPEGTTASNPDQGRGRTDTDEVSVQKYFRVNGVPRRASEIVGQINAVMFSPHDLDLVYGSPSVRRRYLDILISQSDNRYLRSLQRYQRVTYQRNHLLRMVRARRSGLDELGVWDDELVNEGKQIMARRVAAVRLLSDLAGPTARELTEDAESLELRYRPSIPVADDASEEMLGEILRETIVAERDREIAQGATLAGPHRDDIQFLIGGKDAGAYASRGQTRTAVVALKLAEARFLEQGRGTEPVILLDDVLSELDAARRARLLATVERYGQCFITVTDAEPIDDGFLSKMCRFALREGQMSPVA